MTKRPFDPPVPEPASPLDTAGTLALGFGAVAVAAFAYPVAYVLASLPWPRREELPFDPDAALREAGALHTSAARIDERGQVQCMRCSSFVSYATMSLNEDGAFCSPCAERLTAAAVATE